ncbi:MAG: c-type cytochrome [Burkholderiaceae bacterium]
MRVSRVLARALAGLSAAACFGGSGDAPAQEASSGSADAAQKVAASICASCHGPTGVSVSPLFPKLAGQQEAYLLAQLKAFKGKTRAEADAHDYMWGMATLLDDSLLAAMAHYYAMQKPAPGVAGDASLIARGRQIYEQGDPAHQVAPCASCHGKSAEGATIFPRLAGQHAAYIRRQLEAIQKTFRDSPIMHGVIKDLDAGQIAAVAEYVQSM